MLSPNNFSYKDFAARVVNRNSIYYRYIFNNYKSEYDHLIDSGLYSELTKKGLLIEHQEIENDTDEINVHKLIRPVQIPFQSYPFEWSYNQWLKVALAYLKINRISLKYGMILKDATPFNFYLLGGDAILLDTSSFIFFTDKDKWIAYEQFCKEILGVITLMHYNGHNWSTITRTQLKGFPLNFISKQLPLKSWFNLNTLLHIHIHAIFNKKNTSKHKKTTGFSIEKLISLINLIDSQLKKWNYPNNLEKNWNLYYEKDIESNIYLSHKEEILTELLKKINPKSTIDLGANTGRFSKIALKYSERVVALESDELCVNLLEKEITNNQLRNLYCAVMDLTEATSDIGLLNKEFKSIYKRGKSDLVLALALIHHLHISNYISLQQIAEILFTYSKQFVIVEFIPVNDNKIKLLVQDKNTDLSNYTEEKFIEAIEKYFTIKETKQINDSNRKIFFLEKMRDE